jgi:hypothetical protein
LFAHTIKLNLIKFKTDIAFIFCAKHSDVVEDQRYSKTPPNPSNCAQMVFSISYKCAPNVSRDQCQTFDPIIKDFFVSNSIDS